MKLTTSTNDYFSKTAVKLLDNWITIQAYLFLKGYDSLEIKVYKKAYDYFSKNPLDFDGATMTEDLCDLYNLDLDAMIHDYFYIVYNVSSSYNYMALADALFYHETLRKGKSSWNAGFRRFLLKLKSFLGFSMYSRLIMKRVFTEQNKGDFINDFKTLSK